MKKTNDVEPVEEKNERNKLRMMRGTTRNLDYVVVGQRGEVGLGVKVLGIVGGQAFGSQNQFFMVRVRSAPLSSEEMIDNGSNIVSLKDQGVEYAKAWGDIPWDNENGGAKRNSTHYCVPIPGSGPKDDPEVYLKTLLDGEFVVKLCEGIFKLVPEEHRVILPEQLLKHVRDTCAPMVKRAVNSIAAKNLAAKLANSATVFAPDFASNMAKNFSEAIKKEMIAAGYDVEDDKKADHDPDAHEHAVLNFESQQE